MNMVLLTAVGVGGATVVGALIGFLFQGLSHKFSDIILSFAAGVMLAAAVIGLVLPSLEYGNIWITILGIFAGAVFLNFVDKLVPHLHSMAGGNAEGHNNAKLNKVLLFVLAIAIHNLPEGIAAGVGFGTGDVSHAMIIAAGIALQNIPEGIVIIAPMLSAGVSKSRTFVIAMMTGVVEVLGTIIGYMAVGAASAVLPFALSFAGGTMLYIISDEMIPETHSHGYERSSTYSLLVGFTLMLIMDMVL